jgi:hypothetical protein
MQCETSSKCYEKQSSEKQKTRVQVTPTGKVACTRKAAVADIEWHNDEGANIPNRLPEIYTE